MVQTTERPLTDAMVRELLRLVRLDRAEGVVKPRQGTRNYGMTLKELCGRGFVESIMPSCDQCQRARRRYFKVTDAGRRAAELIEGIGAVRP